MLRQWISNPSLLGRCQLRLFHFLRKVVKRPNTPYEINIEDLQNTEPENTIAVNLNDKVNDDQRLGFRLALLPVNSYFPSLASKPPQTNESDTTLYAISRPKLPTQYLIDGMDDPSDLAIEAVYVNKDVVVEPFFLPESKFPSTIGSRDTQELVLNPPQAVLVLHHPEFDSANLFERFQCIFMDSCNIVCCEAGKSDTGALVFPTNAPRSDGDYTLPSNEDLKLGQYGALGLAFFGPVTVEDMARLAQRISGRYILPIRMSTQICQHLFVPRTPYAPNSNTYSVQHLKAETDGVPTILKSVPLFLVSEVVFPGATSVFTIFELRYKAMIKDHLDHGQVFGIVQRGEEVGTLVRVESVISVDPETGETQVVVRGLRRFRRDAGALRRLEGEKFGLFVADVKLHDDDDCYKDVLNSEGEVEVEGQGQGQSALNVSPEAQGPSVDEAEIQPLHGDFEAKSEGEGSVEGDREAVLHVVRQYLTTMDASREEVEGVHALPLEPLSLLAAASAFQFFQSITSKQAQAWLSMTDSSARFEQVAQSLRDTKKKSV